MAEQEPLLAAKPGDEKTVTPSQETPEYNARVVIAVNLTATKLGKCQEKYPKLPSSAVEVAKDLKEFFESLKMNVHYKKNVDKKGIDDLVTEVIKDSPSYGDHEMILFYFIGHGEKGELLPHCTCKECDPSGACDRESDGKPQQIVELIQRFHGSDTKHLRKLPVLFFFDCCQGSDRNEGMLPMGTLDSSFQLKQIVSYVDRIPDCGNILIAHSTLPLLKAYCHPEHGPIWSRILLENLKINQSIGDALHATQRLVAKIDCSDKLDKDGTNVMHKVQPSMFYSTLYCEPINFCAMKDSVNKADSETVVSSTRDPDSAFVDDFNSKAIEGDDIRGGSELPQVSKSAASLSQKSSVEKSEISRSTNIDLKKELEKRQMDIVQKCKKIHELEEEVTQLKQRAEDSEEKYRSKVAEMEVRINETKERYKEKLRDKERELKRTRNEAQVSEQEHQRVNKALREELDQAKKRYEETINKVEAQNAKDMWKLKYHHMEETKELEIKLREQETELEKNRRELAEERETVAKLQAEMAKEREISARNERDKAIKELEKLRKRADKVNEAADVTVGEVQKVMTSSSLAPSSIYRKELPSSDTPSNGQDAYIQS